ncbi:MAG: M20/M25/M40 family metallo-hydrolase [Erysipelotrichaceae bacterium]|nr:M20/M25/M40 family metallo-hydrolase [Erysipelotrichaceae bacterium]
MKKLLLKNDIEQLTKTLVSIKSVDGFQNGETNLANYIVDYFNNLSYFKNNPEQLCLVKTKDDTLDRHSIISYIKGKGNKTIILMGHIDTVDTKDYGPIEDYAYKCDELPSKLKEYFNLDEEIINDIDSNEYLFGRGALDMKSGVAVHMCIMKYFAEHLDELNGNLLFIGECDEEGSSLGIISCLDKLIEIKEKEKFEYITCINTDFHTPSNGKDKPCVHIGTIGKLLPCFAVFGKEAHVGDSFNCFDPNLLLSEISRRISMNVDLCDVCEDGSTVPPISLKQMDDKDSYSVQTSLCSLGYYNYLIYNSSIGKVINNCKKIASDSFDEIINYLNNQYKKYCELNKCEYSPLPWTNKVYTYEEWYKYLSSCDQNFEKEISDYALKLNKENPNMDLRLFGYEMIKKSYSYYKDKDPVVVLFFGTMFYSPVECKDTKLINIVNKSIKEVDNNVDMKMFYPYISDMSFLANDNSEEEIEMMLHNCPQHNIKYVYPYKLIKELNIPVINVGTYGKDGHKFSERVNKKHTFETVPNIIHSIICNYL